MTRRTSLVAALTAAAAIPAAAGAVALVNPLSAGTDLPTFLMDILSFVIQIGTVVVIFMLVFVGYKFVAARGNPSGLEEAKRMLLYTIIGALILLGAQVIASSIQATVTAITG
jgi:heme/copper-type cytochrome/quinol oxidase subunit 2